MQYPIKPTRVHSPLRARAPQAFIPVELASPFTDLACALNIPDGFYSINDLAVFADNVQVVADAGGCR